MIRGKAYIMFAIMVIMIFAILTSSGQAQMGKFGYVDSDRVFAEYKDWTKAQEEFNTQYKAWDDEAKEMQIELEEMIGEFETQKLILSAEKKKEREAAIEAKRQSLDAFTREIFGPGGTAERKNNKGNYDFIYTSSALAYAKKDYDITDKIIELLSEE